MALEKSSETIPQVLNYIFTKKRNDLSNVYGDSCWNIWDKSRDASSDFSIQKILEHSNTTTSSIFHRDKSDKKKLPNVFPLILSSFSPVVTSRRFLTDPTEVLPRRNGILENQHFFQTFS